jgi:hypothetical protein
MNNNALMGGRSFYVDQSNMIERGRWSPALGLGRMAYPLRRGIPAFDWVRLTKCGDTPPAFLRRNNTFEFHSENNQPVEISRISIAFTIMIFDKHNIPRQVGTQECIESVLTV